MTLEELLNKLIEKGWKPFGNEKIVDAETAERNINLLNEEVNWVSKFKDKVAFSNWVLIFDEINLRELVSKESWLWQFVCENGMTEKKIEYWEKFTWTQMLRYTDDYVWSMYQYYLLESALCDEDKLEEFLLDSIKLWEK